MGKILLGFQKMKLKCTLGKKTREKPSESSLAGRIEKTKIQTIMHWVAGSSRHCL